MPRNDDDDSVHPPPPPPKKLDSSSPYYIGPYERPGDFITTARLNLNNYTDWVHDMTMALESRRKFGFVNGTYIRPQPPCSAEDWRVLQSTLYSWIINTIEKDVKSILPRFNNAKDLWDALKNKFSHSDGPQLHQIMMDLSTCRQAEGTSMSNYYSRLTQLWTELDVHEPLVGCSADCNCGRVCSAIEIYASRRASSRLHQFLLGVLPAFSSLRSVILSQNPLPDVDRVFQMFCTEERLHCITSAVPVVPDLSALNVRGFPRQLSRGGLSRLERMKLYCTYCHKNVFPFRESQVPGTDSVAVDAEPQSAVPAPDDSQSDVLGDADNAQAETSMVGPADDVSAAVNAQAENSVVHSSVPAVVVVQAGDSATATAAPDSNDGEASQLLGRGRRLRTPNSGLRDFIVGTTVSPPLCTSGMKNSSSGITYPLSNYIDSSKFPVDVCSFLAAITSQKEPKSYKEASSNAGWRKAMQDEISALLANETWTLAPLPPGKKALGSKWLYKIKYKSDSSIERLKARLVIFGNHQREGIDYEETFAPVVKMTTVRIFMAVAAVQNWSLHQMDVHNAFLHGDLQEEVYMRLPPGFEAPEPGLVCRLKKSLYGLKQAPRCWFAKLAVALTSYGFEQSKSDHSLFALYKNGARLHVLIYVDDLILSGNDDAAVSHFKKYLNDCFRMKDLGELRYFLGIEIVRDSSGIALCQRKYALDIVSDVGYLGCKPASTPMEPRIDLGGSDTPLLDDATMYRRLIGRLVYLTVTRPDLTYAVHTLSQFMQAPRVCHWDAALRTIRYLKSSPGQGLFFSSSSDLRVLGWCDSDYDSCSVSRRSVTGWVVFIGSSIVLWKTKKQPTVSLSSAEAEYRAMRMLLCELKWMDGLLPFLGVPVVKPIGMRCDNQSALHLAKNPIIHERTKHIEIDCHFVRDALKDGFILPNYVPTDFQLADILTKPLAVGPFMSLLGKLGVHNCHAPT